jgi:hypothetical protein
MCAAATSDETNDKRPVRTQGMNWISQHKRLAIYLRDGMACTYCGKTGVKLSLDHLLPYSLGGSNKETNLVTCCAICNSARGNRPVKDFAVLVAAELGIEADDITRRIKNSIRRVLPLAEAKQMVERSGSCAKAIAADC